MEEIINKFPGLKYKQFEDGSYHNIFMGTDLGFGGYVYAEPQIARRVAMLDATNMHGASLIALNKLGPYTKNYIDIRNARIAIKHRDYKALETMFDGKFMPYVKTDEEADNLQAALKLILNSTYGICAATFDNPIRDKRDVQNTIALRGACFMRLLQEEVTKRGFQVMGIKTDSIKIPHATDEIISFVQEFGKKYGYEMEHECTYDRICLVNDAVYIAKYDDKGIRNKGGKHANEWTATGAEFQHPYVFKSLFSKESIDFKDYCETKSVQKGEMYLDMNENLPEGEHNYKFVGKVGSFVPMVKGGGVLYRLQNDKYYAVGGTKGYRWLEAEDVKTYRKEDDIDIKYFEKLNKDAIDHISKFGDFERFVNDPDYDPELDKYVSVPEGMNEEVPFDEDKQFMNKPE